MQRADELRRKAKLCWRAASQPTQGGSDADRVLRELAHRLEREAADADKAQEGS
jgi:hypothetical protein